MQDWFPLGLTGWITPRNSQELFSTPPFKSINSSVLSLPYGPILTTMCDYWKNHGLTIRTFIRPLLLVWPGWSWLLEKMVSTVFLPRLLRMSLELGTHPYQEKGSPHSLCWAHHFFCCFNWSIELNNAGLVSTVWASFPVLDWMCTPLLWDLSLQYIWPSGMPCTLYFWHQRREIEVFQCCKEQAMCSFFAYLGTGMDPLAMEDMQCRRLYHGHPFSSLAVSTQSNTWVWWTSCLLSGTSFHALLSSLAGLIYF